MYQGFADVYDRLMSDVNYEAWADFYLQMMKAFGIREGKLCECACGTGNLTIPFHRRGFHVTGVDISQEMLWIAAQKARAAGVAIPFVRQDMRELRLHRPMDAVLATCDGVNYLETGEDLKRFFQSANGALRPGGGLFFDVSTPWKMEHLLGNRTLCEDMDDVAYMWHNHYDKKQRTVDMHLTIFVRQEGEIYKRIEEEQRQRGHNADELVDLLHQTGFDRVMVFGNAKMEQPGPEEQRWHIAAIKRQIAPEQEGARTYG